jgi:hypothetical protein
LQQEFEQLERRLAALAEQNRRKAYRHHGLQLSTHRERMSGLAGDASGQIEITPSRFKYND